MSSLPLIVLRANPSPAGPVEPTIAICAALGGHPGGVRSHSWGPGVEDVVGAASVRQLQDLVDHGTVAEVDDGVCTEAPGQLRGRCSDGDHLAGAGDLRDGGGEDAQGPGALDHDARSRADASGACSNARSTVLAAHPAIDAHVSLTAEGSSSFAAPG